VGEREEDPEFGTAQVGDGAIDRRAVALLEGGEEVVVGREQDETIGLLALHAQGSEPGCQLVGVEVTTELSLEVPPEALAGVLAGGAHGRREEIHTLSTCCGKHRPAAAEATCRSRVPGSGGTIAQGFGPARGCV